MSSSASLNTSAGDRGTASSASGAAVTKALLKTGPGGGGGGGGGQRLIGGISGGCGRTQGPSKTGQFLEAIITVVDFGWIDFVDRAGLDEIRIGPIVYRLLEIGRRVRRIEVAVGIGSCPIIEPAGAQRIGQEAISADIFAVHPLR